MRPIGCQSCLLRHFGAAFWLKNSPRNHISGATILFAGK
jgi:hypothetical protein